MRYTTDVLGGLLIISTLSAFWLLRQTGGRRSRLAKQIVMVLLFAMAIHTCFVGAFSGIASYGEPLMRLNPKKFHAISSALSVCMESR